MRDLIQELDWCREAGKRAGKRGLGRPAPEDWLGTSRAPASFSDSSPRHGQWQPISHPSPSLTLMSLMLASCLPTSTSRERRCLDWFRSHRCKMKVISSGQRLLELSHWKKYKSCAEPSCSLSKAARLRGLSNASYTGPSRRALKGPKGVAAREGLRIGSLPSITNRGYATITDIVHHGCRSPPLRSISCFPQES